MKLSIRELTPYLETAISIFQSDPELTEMPFMSSFPSNSCERAAALMCVSLKEKYPNSKILYITGLERKTGEMHFWLEIDNIVIDPTAHQFPEVSAPLICYKPSPLENIFTRESQTDDPTKATDLVTNSNGRWESSLDKLRSAFALL